VGVLACATCLWRLVGLEKCFLDILGPNNACNKMILNQSDVNMPMENAISMILLWFSEEKVIRYRDEVMPES
jgi:hypothetical protein